MLIEGRLKIDLLDEFSPTKINDSQKLATHENHQPVKQPQVEDESEEAAEAFNKQLQEQMAALMGSMDESPAMKKEIEAIMQELGTAAGTETSSEARKDAKVTPSSSGIEEPFQETIRKTMERMHVSGEQATAAAKSEDSQNILAQMMNEMQNEPLEGAEGEDGFNKMLMGMMEQLTNKEILYEPMKELHDKYPAWMEKNKMTTNADDMKRYSEQQRLVQEIVGRFEKNGYSDNSAEDREFVVERMQQVGSPSFLLFVKLMLFS